MNPYVIADTTYNHEGDPNYLLRMINELAELQVQAVKFHLLFDIDSYMARTHPAYEKIKRMLIPEKQWDSIIYYARSKGLDVVLLCDDIASLRYAKKVKPTEIEVHSSNITDFNILKELRGYDGKVMLGVGGASFDEIDEAFDFLGCDHVTLMYGFNGWSTAPEDIQLSRMIALSEEYNMGYADHTFWNHEDNVFLSCAAAFDGFNILEKHYTCDPGVERTDFKEAVGWKLMREIQRKMALACDVYGSGIMSDAEVNFARKIRKVDGLRR